VKEIEKLVRSDAWDRATQVAFRAHLEKPMRDTARMRYCERKASFMIRSEHPKLLRAAERLIDWALGAFPDADAESLGLARITRGQARRELTLIAKRKK
jgi:hypothetical protein